MDNFQKRHENATKALAERQSLLNLLTDLQAHEGYIWLWAQLQHDYEQKLVDAIQPSNPDITEAGRSFIAGEAWALRRVHQRVDTVIQGMQREVKEFQRMVDMGDVYDPSVTTTDE